jgi:hypothetical protein
MDSENNTGGAGNQAAAELTPEAAQAQLAELRAGGGDQKLWAGFHAGTGFHASDIESVEKVRSLYAAAYRDGRPTTPEEREAHDTFGAPADPTVYEINHSLGRALNEDEQAADGHFRGWMHAGGLPKFKGDFLAGVLQKEAPRFAGMSLEERAAHGEEVRRQMMGLPDGAAKLAAAQRLVDEVERTRPGLKAWLNETGLGSCFELVLTLGQHAHRRGKTR